MISGGWAFVWSAYALSLGALCVLAVIVALRLQHWSKRARALDETKRERAA